MQQFKIAREIGFQLILKPMGKMICSTVLLSEAGLTSEALYSQVFSLQRKTSVAN